MLSANRKPEQVQGVHLSHLERRVSQRSSHLADALLYFGADVEISGAPAPVLYAVLRETSGTKHISAGHLVSILYFALPRMDVFFSALRRSILYFLE